MRQAVEEGLIDPRRSSLLGMRGGLTSPRDHDEARDMGFTVAPWDDLAQLGTGVVLGAIEIAAGKSFLSFDVGFVDPAFAPGAGTREVGGPTSAQALALLRGCRGLDIVGADVVDLAVARDTARLTAALAATVAYEIVTLVAARRPAAE